MRKWIIFMVVLCSNGIYAQGRGAPKPKRTGTCSQEAAWGIGLGMLAALGIVVGVVATTSSHSPNHPSH